MKAMWSFLAERPEAIEKIEEMYCRRNSISNVHILKRSDFLKNHFLQDSTC